MAQVTVFVDDAVLGDVSDLCVKDGVPTGDQIVVREQIGDRAGLGVAWLLLLAGPLGWLGLALISAGRRGSGELLTVKLPMSEPAYQRVVSARRLRRRAIGAGVIAGGVAVVALLQGAGDASGSGGAWRALALVAACVVLVSIGLLIVADSRIRSSLVGVTLDASRRWVTLSRVHPAFAAAADRHALNRGT